MLAPGTQIGRYLVSERVGTGATGDLYQVEHRALGTILTMKCLPDELVVREEVREKFLEEARILASCRHAGLVRVTDVVEQADPPVAGLVMEPVDGEALSDRIARGPVPVLEAVGLVSQVLEALAYLHERGISHPQLEPDDIVVDGWGKVRLRAIGTLGGEAADDLFAVGALFYELVTGRALSEGGERAEPLPEAFEEVVAQALAERPEERFSDALSFLAALTHAESEHSRPPLFKPPREAARDLVEDRVEARERFVDDGEVKAFAHPTTDDPPATIGPEPPEPGVLQRAWQSIQGGVVVVGVLSIVVCSIVLGLYFAFSLHEEPVPETAGEVGEPPPDERPEVSVVSAPHTRRAVEKALRDQEDLVRRCQRASGVRGVLRAEVVVAVDGSVQGASARFVLADPHKNQKDRALAAEMEACVQRGLSNARFPSHGGETWTLREQWTF